MQRRRLHASLRPTMPSQRNRLRTFLITDVILGHYLAYAVPLHPVLAIVSYAIPFRTIC